MCHLEAVDGYLVWMPVDVEHEVLVGRFEYSVWTLVLLEMSRLLCIHADVHITCGGKVGGDERRLGTVELSGRWKNLLHGLAKLS